MMKTRKLRRRRPFAVLEHSHGTSGALVVLVPAVREARNDLPGRYFQFVGLVGTAPAPRVSLCALRRLQPDRSPEQACKFRMPLLLKSDDSNLCQNNRH
jgi:hypothetical protein